MPGTPPAPPAVLLMGPTASGKSALALALAARFRAEIISVDSAQVYRGMDIGTAKPIAADRARVPHHLIDIIEPTERYSAARFRADAIRLIHDICARGRLPLLVGGTMLYFKALREGLSELPAANAGIRAAIDEEAASRGWPGMHAELAKVDPRTAARLKPADSQRIQRALEVFRQTGTALSALIGQRADAPPFHLIPIGLVPTDRTALHRRIAARFDSMLDAGLIEELEELRARFALSASMPAMRCVGYRQVWQFLEGEFDRASLRERGVFATRQLAKRQLTWLRSMAGLQVLDCFTGSLPELVAKRIERELAAHA